MKNKHLPRERIMAPKGYNDHDLAGSKLAKHAADHRIGVKHPSKLTVIFGRIIRLAV